MSRTAHTIFSMILTVALFFVFACDQKPKNPVAEYGDSLIGAYKSGQHAGEIGNLEAVRKAVAAYHALNDKYPESLYQVKDLIGSNIDLSQYDYNPENGSVSLKK
jgi:outer membrane protein assembly factor BamD (BamD/ComL family)